MLTFPSIDPVAFSLLGLDVRWYGIAYMAGVLLGWRVVMRYQAFSPQPINAKTLDAFIPWVLVGIVVGGRLGHVFFYDFDHYLTHWIEIPQTWKGGMSFHGGLLGVIVATTAFCKKYTLRTFAFFDLLALATPVGLFFGRIANFINGELYGRITTSPLGMIFPYGGPYPRHPSQLYEAVLEGLVLGALLIFSFKKLAFLKKEGATSGLFLIGYGLFRFIGEFFREPDENLGFFIAGTTMGQWLCLPMILAGGVIFYGAFRCFEKKSSS